MEKAEKLKAAVFTFFFLKVWKVNTRRFEVYGIVILSFWLTLVAFILSSVMFTIYQG